MTNNEFFTTVFAAVLMIVFWFFTYLAIMALTPLPR